MALGHGKRTQITVAAGDISAWTKNSEFTRGADKHDTTGYGADDHTFGGDGLRTGEFVCDGLYDGTAGTGTRAILEPLVGTVVTVTRKPEGTGSGKPLQTFQAFVDEYKETNPVADYIKWAAKMTVSGLVAKTTQS